MRPASRSTLPSLLLLLLLPTLSASLIPISTFTDYQCNTPSTAATNVSLPLDVCVVTVGIQSFQLPKTPCAGGGAPSVLNYGFTDNFCSKEWLYHTEYGDGCYRADGEGAAFGSILLTCKEEDPSR